MKNYDVGSSRGKQNQIQHKYFCVFFWFFLTLGQISFLNPTLQIRIAWNKKKSASNPYEK